MMPARFATVIVLWGASGAWGGVYSYECNSFPVESGWTLLQAWCDPVEWVDEGHLFQRVEFCPGYDPPQGQQFDYSRSLGEFLGADRFFVEWRLATTGDRSELPFVAPAALVVWNGGSVNYHFTIADDQLRFVRDNRLPVLYPEIARAVAHTYRLELFSDLEYVFYIDSETIDAGVPEGAFPSGVPGINTRAKAKFFESTTIWDYIRWGDIPIDASGDFDSDEDVDGRDFYFFHECLANARLGINGGPGENAGPGCRFADFDSDMDVDLHDLGAFQNAFTGGQ